MGFKGLFFIFHEPIQYLFFFPAIFGRIRELASCDNQKVRLSSLKAIAKLAHKADDILIQYFDPSFIDPIFQNVHDFTNPELIYFSLKIIDGLTRDNPKFQNLIIAGNLINAFLEVVQNLLNEIEKNPAYTEMAGKDQIILLGFQIFGNIGLNFVLTEEQLNIIFSFVINYLSAPVFGAKLYSLSCLESLFAFSPNYLNSPPTSILHSPENPQISTPLNKSKSSDPQSNHVDQQLNLYEQKVNLLKIFLNEIIFNQILTCFFWKNDQFDEEAENERLILSNHAFVVASNMCLTFKEEASRRFITSELISLYQIPEHILTDDTTKTEDFMSNYVKMLGIIFQNVRKINHTPEIKSILPILRDFTSNLIPNLIDYTQNASFPIKESTIYTICQLINFNSSDILHVIINGNNGLICFFIDNLNNLCPRIACESLRALRVLFQFGCDIQIENEPNIMLKEALLNGLDDAIEEAYETFEDNDYTLIQLDEFKKDVENKKRFAAIDQEIIDIREEDPNDFSFVM